jgi:hypothetical protein
MNQYQPRVQLHQRSIGQNHEMLLPLSLCEEGVEDDRQRTYPLEYFVACTCTRNYRYERRDGFFDIGSKRSCLSPAVNHGRWLSLELIHAHAYPQVVALTRMMTRFLRGALYTLPPH